MFPPKNSKFFCYCLLYYGLRCSTLDGLGSCHLCMAADSEYIIPAMPWHGLEVLRVWMEEFFRASITLYLPTIWRSADVVFIPIPEKKDYNWFQKSYRPIRLSQMDNHVMEGRLKEYPLDRNQHAYRRRKSTGSAHQEAVSKMWHPKCDLTSDGPDDDV